MVDGSSFSLEIVIIRFATVYRMFSAFFDSPHTKKLKLRGSCFYFLVPYALDEPSFNSKVAISVFEEMSESYDMMVLANDLPRLYYQNAIFIALGKTFNA